MTKEEARIRNWQKSRLVGFCLNTHGLTPEEIVVYKQMLELKEGLLTNWDSRSAAMANTPPKKYRCWCGKRTNTEYINPNMSLYAVPYLCKAHFKEAKEELNGNT